MTFRIAIIDHYVLAINKPKLLQALVECALFGSFDEKLLSKPTTGITDCCAWAVSGHTTAALLCAMNLFANLRRAAFLPTGN